MQRTSSTLNPLQLIECSGGGTFGIASSHRVLDARLLRGLRELLLVGIHLQARLHLAGTEARVVPVVHLSNVIINNI